MKKILLILSLIAATLIAAPTAAQAHTGDMSVTALCNVETGQYDVSVSLTTSNTSLAGETLWRVGSGRFEGTPSSSAGMDRGPVASQGAQTISLGSFSLPGDTTGKGPWVYAHTAWTDGFAKGSDGQLLQNLSGDCKIPEPPFDGVEKYQPTYSADCYGWSWSHPAFRIPGSGIEPASYTVRIGAGNDPVAYEPGQMLSGEFADPYTANNMEITLWAHYANGKPFAKQQLGQTKMRAAACEKPVPEQPTALSGEEIREQDPVCNEPLDGTAVAVIEKRTWERPYVWNAEVWEWQLGEQTFTDWAESDRIEVDADDDCSAAAVPPVADKRTSAPEPALANTGSETDTLAIGLGVGILLIGGGFIVALVANRKRNS